MKNWKCILIVLMVSIDSGGASYMLSIQISKKNANIGDDIEVTCKVSRDRTDGEDGSSFPLIVWVKRQGDTEVEIGTNNYINSDFQEVGRYNGQVDYEYDDNDELNRNRVSAQLNITDVKPEDSGEIGCRIPQQHIEIFRSLTVFVPATSILLNSIDVDGTHVQSYNNGTELTFDESHVLKFYCHVTGSYPSPIVAIFIGDQDITDQFEKEEKLLKKEGLVNGLDELSYAVTLRNESFIIDYSFADKRLECRATLPGSGFPPMTTGINIKLYYKPKFVCNKTMTVRYLEEDVYIECTVYADPEIDQFRIYWTPAGIYWNPSMHMTMEGNSSDGLHTSYVRNGLSATEKIMTLMISRIFKQHFRTYYFEAENELGNETHAIEVIRDMAGVAVDVPVKTSGKFRRPS